MSEKVTAEKTKEEQVTMPAIGQIVTITLCETNTEIEIKVEDAYRCCSSCQIAGSTVKEQKYISRYDGKEHSIPVGDRFEAMEAYGKYWTIYEPHTISGNDSKPIRTLVGHEEAVVISKEEGIIDYQRTR
jgi:hypothetical protein